MPIVSLHSLQEGETGLLVLQAGSFACFRLILGVFLFEITAYTLANLRRTVYDKLVIQQTSLATSF